MEKIQIKGRLGTNPNLQMTQHGEQILTFPIALNSQYKNKRGITITKPNWHQVIICRKDKFEMILEFLKKGKLVEIHGTLSFSVLKNKYGKEKKNPIIFIKDEDDNIGFPQRSSFLPMYYNN